MTELEQLRAELATLKAADQATACAQCGERKHTPLRRDHLGGYVCLTCIDAELNAITQLRAELATLKAEIAPKDQRLTLRKAEQLLEAAAPKNDPEEDAYCLSAAQEWELGSILRTQALADEFKGKRALARAEGAAAERELQTARLRSRDLTEVTELRTKLTAAQAEVHAEREKGVQDWEAEHRLVQELRTKLADARAEIEQLKKEVQS